MARTKLMDCGHGSRHLSPYDGRCRRCVRNAKTEGEPMPSPVAPTTKAKVHEHDAA